MKKQVSPEQDKPISFKLREKEFWQALKEEAGRENESVHQAARRLMLKALCDDGQDELREDIAELRASLTRLREDMVTIIRPILAGAMMKDVAAIDTWLREHLAS